MSKPVELRRLIAFLVQEGADPELIGSVAAHVMIEQREPGRGRKLSKAERSFAEVYIEAGKWPD